MSTWKSYSVLKDDQSQSVLASQTAQVVSREFAIRGRTRLRVDVVTSAAVTAAAQTAKLQTAVAKDGSGDWIWETVKSVSITTNAGYKVWSLLVNPEVAADQSFLPLAPRGRVVVTTGIGDTSTVVQVTLTDEA